MAKIGKDSRIKLLKIHHYIKAIASLAETAPSDYTFPSVPLSEARGYLHTDLSACLKLLKKASKLYTEESALALRYLHIRDAAESSHDPAVVEEVENYRQCIRKGDYSGAKKVLGRLTELGQLYSNDSKLGVSVSDDPPVLKIVNNAAVSVSIESVSVTVNRRECVSGRVQKDLWPGMYFEVPLELPEKGLRASVKIDYYKDGGHHTEFFTEAF